MCDVSPKNESIPSRNKAGEVNPYPRGSMCWKNEPWDMCAFGIFDPAASVKETCKLYRYKDTDDGSYLESYTTMGQLLSEDYAVSPVWDGQPILAGGGTCAVVVFASKPGRLRNEGPCGLWCVPRTVHWRIGYLHGFHKRIVD